MNLIRHFSCQVSFKHQPQEYHDSMKELCRSLLGGEIYRENGTAGIILSTETRADGVYLYCVQK